MLALKETGLRKGIGILD